MESFFAWDSSFGKVIDKYVLLGSFIPCLMIFSRWGDTHSLNSLIAQLRGRPVVNLADRQWAYGWVIRAVILFTAVLYFSAGFTKVFEGTWLYNPHVLLDKVLGNLGLASIGVPSLMDKILFQLTRRLPLVFVLGQYLVLAFELSFPIALVNQDLRTGVYSATALFHTSALVTLSIGFAPMIVVLGIVVDWQAHLERWAPKWLHRLIHPSWGWAAALGGLVAVLSGMSVWLLTAHARAATWLDFVPNQERVWFAVAPFALLAGAKSALRVIWAMQSKLRPAAMGGGAHE